MANAINELKKTLGAGARPSKYRIVLTFPPEVPIQSDQRDINVLAKSASFPSLSIGAIEVFNQGRKLIIPGDTSFTNSWTLTFYNTEAHNLRRDIVSWQASCDHFQNNVHTGVPADLMVNAVIMQLDSAGKETAVYTFHNVFPQELGEIQAASDQIDSIEEFDVTFAFTDWVVGTNEFQEPGSAGSPTLNVSALKV